MKQIILRNVPDDIHKKLKLAAVQAEIPMQNLIMEILTREVGKAKKKAGKA